MEVSQVGGAIEGEAMESSCRHSYWIFYKGRGSVSIGKTVELCKNNVVHY